MSPSLPHATAEYLQWNGDYWTGPRFGGELPGLRLGFWLRLLIGHAFPHSTSWPVLNLQYPPVPFRRTPTSPNAFCVSRHTVQYPSVVPLRHTTVTTYPNTDRETQSASWYMKKLRTRLWKVDIEIAIIIMQMRMSPHFEPILFGRLLILSCVEQLDNGKKRLWLISSHVGCSTRF